MINTETTTIKRPAGDKKTYSKHIRIWLTLLYIHQSFKCKVDHVQKVCCHIKNACFFPVGVVTMILKCICQTMHAWCMSDTLIFYCVGSIPFSISIRANYVISI